MTPAFASSSNTTPSADDTPFRERYFQVFRYGKEAIRLVWTTSHSLTFALFFFTLLSGIMPTSIAYLGKLIVDEVVTAMNTPGGASSATAVFLFVLLEACLVIVLSGAQKALAISQSLLRAQLGFRVNRMILEKATQLDLTHFEDSEFYDKLTRARREASSRPLSLVNKTLQMHKL